MFGNIKNRSSTSNQSVPYTCTYLRTGTIKVIVKHPRFCNLRKVHVYTISCDKLTVAGNKSLTHTT